MSLSSNAFNTNCGSGIITVDAFTSTMSLGGYGKLDDPLLFDEKEFEYNKYGLFKKVYSGDRNNYPCEELRVLDLQTQQYFNFFYKSMDEKAVFEEKFKVLSDQEYELLVGHVKSFCKTERLLEQIKLAEEKMREYEKSPFVVIKQSKSKKSELRVFERKNDEDFSSAQNIFSYHNHDKPRGFFRRALDRLVKIKLEKKSSQGKEVANVKRIKGR
jgi:hypothetical protein